MKEELYAQLKQLEPSVPYPECGDGWYELLHALLTRLAQLKQPDEPLRVLQIKEKFGGQRFYVSVATEEMWHAIEAAEQESFHVCEECSSRDNVTTRTNKGRGWTLTLCAACRTEEEKA